jgi:hypothetical protein
MRTWLGNSASGGSHNGLDLPPEDFLLFLGELSRLDSRLLDYVEQAVRVDE